MMSQVFTLTGVVLALSGWARAEDSAPLAPDENRAEWVRMCTDWDEWDKPAAPYRIHR